MDIFHTQDYKGSKVEASHDGYIQRQKMNIWILTGINIPSNSILTENAKKVKIEKEDEDQLSLNQQKKVTLVVRYTKQRWVMEKIGFSVFHSDGWIIVINKIESSQRQSEDHSTRNDVMMWSQYSEI